MLSYVSARKVRTHRPIVLRAATFRFSGGSPPEQVPFALVSVLRAGPFVPSGAAGLKVWPDFGRMDPSARRPLGYELVARRPVEGRASHTCRSCWVAGLARSTLRGWISAVSLRFVHKSVHNLCVILKLLPPHQGCHYHQHSTSGKTAAATIRRLEGQPPPLL
jgi:hypothetical protein